jgi:hypothetical protein
MQTLDSRRPVLTLYQNGRHASLDDDQLSLLGDLTVRRLETQEDSLHGYGIEKARYSLLRSQNGFWIPNAGCIPALRLRAHDRNIELRVVASPTIAQLPPPVSLTRVGYPDLARFVRENEQGLIRITASFDEAIVVSELTLAYPCQRIVVLGNNVQSLATVQRKLRTVDDGAQLASGRRPLQLDDEEELPRIICATFLEASEIDFATCDIVVMLEASHCIHQRVQQALEQVDARFRLFGITSAGREHSPYETGVMMSVFGPAMIDLMPYRRTRREVSVAWVKHQQPSIRQDREGPDFDYKCCWHNERRNRAIAKAAKAIAAGTLLGEQNSRDVDAWLNEQDGRPQSVTILVDRLDHAIAIGKKLSDWPIVIHKGVDLRGYPGSIRSRLKRDRETLIDGSHQIVLTDARFRGGCSDVVLWAGGGPYVDSIPDSWLTEASDSCRPLLIIDFVDAFNRQMRAWGVSRREGYGKRDIFEVGIERTQGRAQRFLRQQVGGGR